MTEERKMSNKSRNITLAVIAVVCGGLWLFKTVNPQGYEKSGIKSFIESPLKSAVREDESMHAELHAKKVYDAGEMLNVKSPRYDYTFTCKAKENIVLSDITITAGEEVTSRNTGVGKDEKSDRRLDSESVDETITLKPGEQYEKTGRLTRKSSIEGSEGYIELNARVRLLDQEDKKDYNPTATKTFLKLIAPAA